MMPLTGSGVIFTACEEALPLRFKYLYDRNPPAATIRTNAATPIKMPVRCRLNSVTMYSALEAVDPATAVEVALASVPLELACRPPVDTLAATCALPLGGV